MTEQRRKEIVKEYLSTLQAKARKGIIRKSWVPGWLQEKGLARRTLYDWLKKYPHKPAQVKTGGN